MVLDWLAVGLNWQRVRPFSKPLVVLLLILWTFSNVGWHIDVMLTLVFLAQAFGLAGDIFLLLSRKWFLWGLAAFLAGHLFTIAALLRLLITQGALPTFELLTGGLFIWGLVLLGFYRLFRPAFRRAGRSKTFWVPVQVYAGVLSGLTVLALWTGWAPASFSPGLLALPAGGVLFLLSDTLLAYDRFVKKIKTGKLWVRMTYHLAQFSLAVGWVFWIRIL